MKKKFTIVDAAIVVTLIILVALLLAPVLFPESSPQEIADTNGDGKITLSDYDGKKIGSITGVNYDLIINKYVPGSTVEYYSNYPDLVVALKAGIIDAFIIDEPALAAIMMEDPEVSQVPENMSSWLMSFAFSEKSKIPNLYNNMNSFIALIREDGVLDEIKDIWFGDDESKKVIPPLDDLTGENGTVKVALETTYAPIVYMKNEQVVGYEADILYRFCDHYHYKLEFVDMQYDTILPAIATGKCDIGASGLECTEDHAESVLLSTPHLEAGTSLAVLASDLLETNNAPAIGTGKSFSERAMSSFEKNLVTESRWKLIIKGIGTTCLITVLSALFGSIIAFGMCLLRRCASKLANPVLDAYVRIIQGIPLVILLMILFYVIFANSGIESVWIAVIGFSISFSAHAAVIMQSGLDSIDAGQEEAALALGFTHNQAFFRFLYPQAALRFLPVYRGELVNLLNNTSIVGYIAVQDLTKMSDIIRSRSYEAFLPLILSTLIYFVLARIITVVVDIVLKEISPRRMRSKGGEKA
jgi:polar amino acid transport system substrate-binding protein